VIREREEKNTGSRFDKRRRIWSPGLMRREEYMVQV